MDGGQQGDDGFHRIGESNGRRHGRWGSKGGPSQQACGQRCRSIPRWVRCSHLELEAENRGQLANAETFASLCGTAPIVSDGGGMKRSDGDGGERK